MSSVVPRSSQLVAFADNYGVAPLECRDDVGTERLYLARLFMYEDLTMASSRSFGIPHEAVQVQDPTVGPLHRKSFRKQFKHVETARD